MKYSMIKLGFKHWRRDISSAEMRLLLVATLVAAFSMTLITSFSDRLTRTMAHRASELIAGDLTLRSAHSVQPEWIDEAKSRGLNHVPALAFATMAFANDKLQLSRVRAVGKGYPLKGNTEVSLEPFAAPELVQTRPEPGTIWAEQRILQTLGIQVGSQIEIGDAVFTVSYILQQDADRSGNFYSPFGRILMNLDDVDKTGVVGLGSRVLHKHYFTGEEQAVIDYANWLEPQLNESERLAGVVDSGTAVGSALVKAQQYLSLSSLVAVLLAGVAIAMASQRFSERHYETAALLRCLGSDQQSIVQLFVTKLLITGILASIIGSAAGFTAHYALMNLMGELLPKDILPPRFTPVAVSLLCALIVLMAFAMAPIQKLKSVSPVRVLRRELNPKPVKLNMFYLIAIISMGGLAFLLTGHLQLTLIFVIGLTLLAFLYGLLSVSLLVFIHKISHHFSGLIKTGFQQLYRHRYYAVSQLGAFAFIFTAITLILVVRTDLFARWQSSIPEGTPNHFALNILPDKKEAFENFLNQSGIEATQFYPIVRGRLTEINGSEVTKIVSKEERPDVISRELNLTWSDSLAEESVLLKGEWWSETVAANMALSEGTSPDTLLPKVSVESEVAEWLDVTLGDVLTFTIAGEKLDAQVASIRQVKWDSFKPNFYMIFEPGVLQTFHHTYLNSFYVSEKNIQLLLDLNREFKAVSIIPVDQIIKQVQQILDQTTVAVEYILLLVLVAGVLLLFATLLSTLTLRKQEAAIYRTLGAQTKFIRQLIASEYMWLGLLAGFLAIGSTELLCAVLYEQIFEVDWTPHWWLWVFTPLSAITAIVLSGWLASRPVMEASPNQLLREVG